MDVKSPGSTWELHPKPELEYGRGGGISCSGEMRRYRKEHQWRRRPPGLILTLRCESVEQTGLDTLVVHAVNDVD